jgi:hypothetical protein
MKLPDKAILPQFPDEWSYLWGWFHDIRDLGADYSPAQIKAYLDLSGVQPERFEVEALISLFRIMSRAGVTS